MSDDTTVGVRRNMSFVSEPVTAALAVGNDCKFPAEKKQVRRSKGREERSDDRILHITLTDNLPTFYSSTSLVAAFYPRSRSGLKR